MDAREVIAKALEQCNGKRMPEFEAANVYALLNKAGFTIMPKEDVEAVREKALEEAATAASDWWHNPKCERPDVAIRSLKSAGRDGKEARE